MNPRIKELWLKALRSEEYSQGRDELKTNAGQYCCLGVLCELAVGEGVIPPPHRGGDGLTWLYGIPGDTNSTSLPRSVGAWAGIDDTNPNVLLDDAEVFLADENDDGKTFEEIAELIERYL